MRSIRRFVASALVACVVIVGTGASASAAEQTWTPGIRFVESATNVMSGIRDITKNTEYGYVENVCLLAAFLTDGGKVTFSLTLTKGEKYVIVGGGDKGTKDLDIKVTDATGKEVASDTDIDPTPVAGFTAQRAGAHTIQVIMAKAGPNGGFATIGILVEGGYRVPVGNLAAALANLILQCEDVDKNTKKDVLFSSGNNQWAVFGSILKQGGETTIEKLLPGAGTRVLVSGGDDTVSDIDLFLLDAKGKVLEEDVDDDAVPRVVYTTARNTNYGFRVKNVKSKGSSLILTAILTVG